MWRDLRERFDLASDPAMAVASRTRFRDVLAADQLADCHAGVLVARSIFAQKSIACSGAQLSQSIEVDSRKRQHPGRLIGHHPLLPTP